MAKVTLSASLDNISGSVGNITYSKTHSRIISKNKSHPGSVNPYIISPAQAAQNTALGSLTLLWQGLTDSQRIAWNALAQVVNKYDNFSKAYQISGVNLFVSCNNNLQLCSQALINDPPVLPQISQYTSFMLSGHVNLPPQHLNLTFTGDTQANLFYKLYIAYGLSAGIMYCENKYRAWQPIPPGSSSPVNLLALYPPPLPVTPISPGKLFCKLIPVDMYTGIPGIPIVNSIIL